jgi:hypothetical protein
MSNFVIIKFINGEYFIKENLKNPFEQYPDALSILRIKGSSVEDVRKQGIERRFIEVSKND